MIDLEKAYVADYQISGNGVDIPQEHIALAYKKVTYTFTATDGTGVAAEQVLISCDLATNTVA